jgi:hypothetical protein
VGKEATARWRAENPEKARESARRSATKWRKANPKEALARKRKWRLKNHSKVRAVEKLQEAGIRRRNKAALEESKNRPCMDCHKNYPAYVMDLDHVRGEKLTAVGHIGPCSLKKLLDEIAKCDVVCSNCHRERTYLRRTVK